MKLALVLCVYFLVAALLYLIGAILHVEGFQSAVYSYIVFGGIVILLLHDVLTDE